MNHQSGYVFDRGYISPHFITNSQKMQVELEIATWFHEKKISNMNDIPIVEQIYEKGEALLIVAEDIEGDARNLLVLNKVQGNMKVAVKAPGLEMTQGHVGRLSRSHRWFCHP